jgi:hypothetical protein
MRFAGLIFFVLLCGHQASACVCNDPPITPLLELKNSDAVFVGRVLSVDETKLFSKNRLSYTRQFIVTFTVQQSLKGANDHKVVLKVGNSDCDIHFSTGERWLVYAHLSNDALTTGGCTRTKLARSAAQDLNCIKHSRCVESCPNCIDPRPKEMSQKPKLAFDGRAT